MNLARRNFPVPEWHQGGTLVGATSNDVNFGTGRPAAAEPSIATMLASLKRHRLFLAIWIAALLAVAYLAIGGLQPRYRAEALIALDTRQIQFSDVSAVVSNVNTTDVNLVRSEVEILQSDQLARQVVRDLHLAERPEFEPKPSLTAGLAATAASLATRIGGPLLPLARELDAYAAAGAPVLTRSERFDAAVAIYKSKLSVFNDGRSYVISLFFEAQRPQLAADIVNRHASLYIESQRQMKDETLQTATGWLDRQVNDLAQRLRQAEATVQTYREAHNLFAPQGNSLAQQQLADLNRILTQARTELSQRESRLRWARDNNGNLTATELVNSELISTLRAQEADARRRLAAASGSLGRNSPELVAIQAEVTDTQRMIRAEETKILGSLASEVAIARDRDADLTRAVKGAELDLAQAERDEAGMRDLDRQATAIRSLYESLLSRQKQVATQVGIQRADAHLVSTAVPSTGPVFPNKRLLYAIALMAASVSGAGITLFRDRRRSGIENLAEAEAASGLRRLAAVPGVRRPFGGRRMDLPDIVASRPRSLAAEAVRTLRTTLALGDQTIPRLLAITSALPGEGKTSVALALARSLASSGAKVLLIEADLRHRTLSRLGRENRFGPGIVGVLQGKTFLGEAVVRDPATALDILSAEAEPQDPQDLLVADRFGRLMKQASADYDHVIIDTPPAGVVSDVLLIGRFVDATLLVVRADTTPRECVTATVRLFQEAGLALAGVVLNATDPGRSNPTGFPGGKRAALAHYLQR